MIIFRHDFFGSSSAASANPKRQAESLASYMIQPETILARSFFLIFLKCFSFFVIVRELQNSTWFDFVRGKARSTLRCSLQASLVLSRLPPGVLCSNSNEVRELCPFPRKLPEPAQDSLLHRYSTWWTWPPKHFVKWPFDFADDQHSPSIITTYFIAISITTF